jgi:hypothetical protein
MMLNAVRVPGGGWRTQRYTGHFHLYMGLPFNVPGGNMKHCANRPRDFPGNEQPKCPRACTAAGCNKSSARGLCLDRGSIHLWCHKCDMVRYCSIECKNEHRREHKEMCKIVQYQRQFMGFDRACHCCGTPDHNTIKMDVGLPDQGSTLKACGGCKQALYCSAACARVAWKSGHKRECKSMAASLAPGMAAGGGGTP